MELFAFTPNIAIILFKLNFKKLIARFWRFILIFEESLLAKKIHYKENYIKNWKKTIRKKAAYIFHIPNWTVFSIEDWISHYL